MRVAIDSGALSSGHKIRGVGKYTKNLITALEELSKKKKNFTVEAVDFSAVHQFPDNFDILHYPYFDLFSNTLPASNPVKTVVTVHDVIPLLYPKNYPPGIRGKGRFLKQKKALQSVKAVITDTQTSKKDIIRFLGYPQNQIFPIHLAPAFKISKVSDTKKELVRKRFNLPADFVLYVGDVNYNKNVAELVKACVEIRTPLIIVGKQAADLETQMSKAQLEGTLKDKFRFLVGRNHPELAHYQELQKLFKKHFKLVRRLGYVEDEDLNVIWQLASVYCQPSLYEGFGLPVLEAMQAGIPVVASRTQALVEIAEDAAIYVDDKEAPGFAGALKEAMTNQALRSKLIKEGSSQLSKYSWQQTAQKTYEVYKKVFESK